MNTVDIPVAACDIHPGDRLVPESGTVRVAVEAVHRDRSQIIWPGFDGMNAWDLGPHDTVVLRCPTEPTEGWSYYAGVQRGTVLGCSCVYRWTGPENTWTKAITLPNCGWCNPNEED